MDKDLVKKIKSNPKYHELVSKRNSFSLKLSLFILAMFYGYVLVIAFNKEILKENYPFSDLVDADVNVLIFPNLTAGNIAYHLLKEIGGIDVIGPILLGLKKPVNVLQLGSSVHNIINMATVAVVDAQLKTRIDTTTEVERTSWWKKLKKKKK